MRGAEQLGLLRRERQPALEALHPQDRLQPAAPLQEDLRHHAGLVKLLHLYVYQLEFCGEACKKKAGEFSDCYTRPLAFMQYVPLLGIGGRDDLSY